MTGVVSDLVSRHCSSCESGTPLPMVTARELLVQLKAWEIIDGKLVKTYAFKNYYETMAFVNGLALVSHREDHHPELVVNYNKCEVRYDTHSVGGLTENDFICAAKADALLKL
jgi:4a-hydroxytetrahydrobiopterin dehydratase